MKILYVENHDIFAKTVIDEFLSDYSVTVVPTVAAALDAITNDSFDLFIVDYDLEDAKGDEFVRACAQKYPAAKIIATTANDRGNVALREAGAHEICRKLQFDRIPGLITKLIPLETKQSTPTANLTLAPKNPKDLVLAWVEAFNRVDADALANFYAPDATNHQVAEKPVSGRDKIRAMFQNEFASAEMHCIVENLFQDGEWAILEWCDPKGLRGCGFFHVVDGKIVFQRGYWDKLSFQKLYQK
jgi:CheY-like chemotaxis protein